MDFLYDSSIEFQHFVDVSELELNEDDQYSSPLKKSYQMLFAQNMRVKKMFASRQLQQVFHVLTMLPLDAV